MLRLRALALAAAVVACSNESHVRTEVLPVPSCRWDPAQPTLADAARDSVPRVSLGLFPAIEPAALAGRRANLVSGFGEVDAAGEVSLTADRAHVAFVLPIAPPTYCSTLVIDCLAEGEGNLFVRLTTGEIGRVACDGRASALSIPMPLPQSGVFELGPEGAAGESIRLRLLRLEVDLEPSPWARVALPGSTPPVEGFTQHAAGAFSRLVWLGEGAKLSLAHRAWTTGRVGEPVEIVVRVITDEEETEVLRIRRRLNATERREVVDLSRFAHRAARIDVELPQLAGWNRWFWTDFRLDNVASFVSSAADSGVTLTTPGFVYERRADGARTLRRSDKADPLPLTEHRVTFAFFERWVRAHHDAGCPGVSLSAQADPARRGD